MISTIKKLDSCKIPYEIRRNIPDIYKFTNITYYDKSFHYHDKDIKTIPSPLLPYFKKDQSRSASECEVIDTAYIYWPMSLNNIGHFLYDNVIPIYKMMVLDQDKFDVDTNSLLILMKRPEEKENEQKLTKKRKEILKIFFKKIESGRPMVSDYRDACISGSDDKKKIYIKNAIFQKSNLKSRPWKEYSVSLQNKQINSEFFYNFSKIIKNNKDPLRRRLEPPGQRPGPGAGSDPTRIVLLSRNDAKWRRVTNEKELVKKLKEKYDIDAVKFEKLSLEEEIKLMTETKILIAPYGAGVMSASLFLPSNSTCIIINPIGFSFEYDFPKMLLKFLKRLNINTIPWINNIGKKNNNVYADRDANMEINIDKILEFLSGEKK